MLAPFTPIVELIPDLETFKENPGNTLILLLNLISSCFPQTSNKLAIWPKNTSERPV